MGRGNADESLNRNLNGAELIYHKNGRSPSVESGKETCSQTRGIGGSLDGLRIFASKTTARMCAVSNGTSTSFRLSSASA